MKIMLLLLKILSMEGTIVRFQYFHPLVPVPPLFISVIMLGVMTIIMTWTVCLVV